MAIMMNSSNAHTIIISTIVTLGILLCHLSPSITGFVPKGNLGRLHPQRLETSYAPHGWNCNSRRKSSVLTVLNNDNTREDMEDNVLMLPLLEAELVKLKGSSKKDNNNVQRIEELKDTIDNAKTAAEFGVRRVQAEFYDAFSTADFEKMSQVWSRSDDVCCVHPGMHSLQGITAVMDSWRQIFAGYAGSDDQNAFKIRPARVKVDICGRTAICTCVEETNGGVLEALNIYRREDGSWKMVNHMASPVMM